MTCAGKGLNLIANLEDYQKVADIFSATIAESFDSNLLRLKLLRRQLETVFEFFPGFDSTALRIDVFDGPRHANDGSEGFVDL